MLTRLEIKNFKKLADVTVELGRAVVLIGPNNSGKSTALQALALWNVGLKRWNEKRSGRETPEKRPGVTINRRDLVSLPVPSANLLWRDLHVRDVERVEGRQQTRNVRIEIVVEGVTSDGEWRCGLEFDYANEESFYCRPLRLPNGASPQRMVIPQAASSIDVVFLPPMSGLAANETRLDTGAINVRIGEGRTAEVLRNLAYSVFKTSADDWIKICEHIERLFGVRLDAPEYVSERGEITMTYREPNNARLDLSSAGRGLQQTLLLLAHLYANPKSVLLLDEPDAHLEILRQRQIYQLLTTIADEQGSQIIAASHSEVILNEAADRDMVVAFVGKPHRIDDRGSQVLKALKQIGFEDYYQAEITGWVLYLEGSTDLAVLRAFAEALAHPARAHLERPLVRYVGNQPSRARDHFFGLREAKADLVGMAIFDRLRFSLDATAGLEMRMWSKTEIENYLTSREGLMEFAASQATGVMAGPLFKAAEAQRLRGAMDTAIVEISDALAKLGKPDPFGGDLKATDDFLDPLFRIFFSRAGIPNLMPKSDYHRLAQFVPSGQVHRDVGQMLDAILGVARKAKPIVS